MTPTELTILEQGSTVTMPWTAFSECLESRDLFVLVDRSKAALLTIPKRVFPSETWLNWFREQSNHGLQAAADQPRTDPAAISTSSSVDWIKFRVRLGLRDYFDRTIASAKTWGIFLFVAAMVIGVGLVAAANPPPHAIYTPIQMFFLFQVPFLFVMMAVLIVVISVYSWLSQIRHSDAQEVAISEESLIFQGALAQGALPWTAYARYKETPWSFIVWNPANSAWVMFPKRAFKSADDLRRCRELLARHLAYSRWFVG